MLCGQQRISVEFKSADASTITKGMRIAMHDLKLNALYVVYPGLHPWVKAWKLCRCGRYCLV
jgi:uncharacterized protein